LIRKVLLGAALLTVICSAAYFHYRQASPPLEIAYAGNRQVSIYSTTAQVREELATANYGDRLDVLGRYQTQVQVRTMKGVTGWVSERDLLSADLWQKAQDLEKSAAVMPVEARGHAKVLSNLRVEPGRDAPRLRQLNKQTPVEIFLRQAVEVPKIAKPGEDEDSAGGASEEKKEDWWLVRAHTPEQTTITGWIVGRFVGLDVPLPLPDYASSSGYRIVAWFELNRVNDPSGQSRPQFLVAGAQGPDGQPCDFTLLRGYTWGVQRQRYETAFVERGICGKLPIKLVHPETAGGDVQFSFLDLGEAPAAERVYRMHQTIIRRVKEGGAAKPRKHAS
jgi:hypothetical protein